MKNSSCVARDSRLITKYPLQPLLKSMQSNNTPPGDWSKHLRYLDHMWGDPNTSDSAPTTPSDWKADEDPHKGSKAKDEDEDPHKGSKAKDKAKAAVKAKGAHWAKGLGKPEAAKAMKTKDKGSAGKGKAEAVKAMKTKDKGSGMKAMKASTSKGSGMKDSSKGSGMKA